MFAQSGAEDGTDGRGRGKSRVEGGREGGKTVIDTASLRDNAARGGAALKAKTAE